VLDVKKLEVNQVYVSNDYRRRVKILGFSKTNSTAAIVKTPEDMRWAFVSILGEGLPGGMLKTMFVALPQFNSAGKSGFRLDERTAE
jgi:hypothetical protein